MIGKLVFIIMGIAIREDPTSTNTVTSYARTIHGIVLRIAATLIIRSSSSITRAGIKANFAILILRKLVDASTRNFVHLLITRMKSR